MAQQQPIQFRGRTRDRGWKHGELSLVNGWPFISAQENGTPCKYAVERETVGQSTGIADYNGTPIYEHDLLRVSQSGMPDIVRVSFANGLFLLIDRNDNPIDSIFGYDPDIFRVVGNTFDNSALLYGC